MDLVIFRLIIDCIVDPGVESGPEEQVCCNSNLGSANRGN